MPAGTRLLILVENLTVPFDRRVWMEATSLVEAGFQVSVICPTGGEYTRPFERSEGVSIHRYRAASPTSSHLSYALGIRGDVRRSLALRERVLELRRRLHGAEHAEVAQALNDVGRSLRFLGRLDEAERHLREAVAMWRGLEGETSVIQTPVRSSGMPWALRAASLSSW